MIDGLWFLWLCRIFRNDLVKVTILGRTYLARNIFWFRRQIASATFSFPIITQRAVYINILGCSCKVSDIFVRFWIFMANINKSLQYQMSRRCVQGERSYSYGRTHRDITKLTNAVWNFVKELKNKNKEPIYYSGYTRAPKLVVSLAQFDTTGV
jgi:hypothetical protein